MQMFPLTEKQDRKAYLVLFFINIVVYWTFIANTGLLYNDDYSRVLLGYGWRHDGRFVANIFYYLINQSTLVFSMGSLPQLLALGCYSYISLLLYKNLISNEKRSDLLLLISLIVSVFPYVAENMAFKYDAPMMALALLLALAPFMFKKQNKKALAGSVFFLGLTILTYQQALNVYMMMASYLIINNLISDKPLRSIFREAGFYIIALALAFTGYKLLQILNILHHDERALFLSFKEMPRGLIQNSSLYIKQTAHYFQQNSVMSAVTVLLLCFYVAFLLKKSLAFFMNKEPFFKKMIRQALLIVAVVIFMVSPSFTTLFTVNYTGYFRYMYSGGVFFTLLIYLLYNNLYNKKQLRAAVLVLALFLGLCFISVTVIFSQLVYWQAAYRHDITMAVANDLDGLIEEHQLKELATVNDIGFAPRTYLYLLKYPLFRSMSEITNNPNQQRHEFRATGLKFYFPGNPLPEETNDSKLSQKLKQYHPKDDFIIERLSSFNKEEATLLLLKNRWAIYKDRGNRAVIEYRQ